MKQKTKQTTKNPVDQPIESDFEDFFTQYLQKKKRNYVKKLAKVDVLQQKDFESLTTEQKDMVTNKHKLQDEIDYYDTIQQHYFKALMKKNPEVLEKKVESTEEKSKNECNSYEDCCQKTLGLYYLGNFVKNSGEAAMQVFAKRDVGIDFQTNLHRLHSQTFRMDSLRAEDMQKAQNGLLEYLKDEELCKGVVDIVKDGFVNKQESVEEKGEQEEDLVNQRASKKESIGRPQLFVMTSEEEDNTKEEPVKVEKKKQNVEVQEIKEEKEEPVVVKAKNDNQTQQKEKIVVPKIVPLPEDSDDEFTAFNKPSNNKRGRNNRGRGRGRGNYQRKEGDQRDMNKPYRGRGNRGNRGNRGRGNRGRDYNQGNQYEQKDTNPKNE
jgi:hypothetical protein